MRGDTTGPGDLAGQGAPCWLPGPRLQRDSHRIGKRPGGVGGRGAQSPSPRFSVEPCGGQSPALTGGEKGSRSRCGAQGRGRVICVFLHIYSLQFAQSRKQGIHVSASSCSS